MNQVAIVLVAVVFLIYLYLSFVHVPDLSGDWTSGSGETYLLGLRKDYKEDNGYVALFETPGVSTPLGPFKGAQRDYYEFYVSRGVLGYNISMIKAKSTPGEPIEVKTYNHWLGGYVTSTRAGPLVYERGPSVELFMYYGGSTMTSTDGTVVLTQS